MKWYLACCDNDGRCFGFLLKDMKSVFTDGKNIDKNLDKLVSFKTKKETTEICMQINLSNALLPNGYDFRVTPVKG